MEVAAVYVDENEVNQAVAGDNVRIKIRGIDEEEISIGFVLCDDRAPIKVAHSFIAQVQILETKNIILAGYNAILHVHTAIEEVQMASLLHLVDKKTKKRLAKPVPFLKAGDVADVKIECKGAVCMEAFRDHSELGRFTLRDEGNYIGASCSLIRQFCEGKTVAIGKVLKVFSSEAAKLETNA